MRLAKHVLLVKAGNDNGDAGVGEIGHTTAETTELLVTMRVGSTSLPNMSIRSPGDLAECPGPFAGHQGCGRATM